MLGCFYVDPINQRPSLAIDQPSSDPVYRGDHLELTANANDPEGQFVSFQWRGYACVPPAESADCDVDPLATSVTQSFALDVPVRRADGTPTEAVRIVLEGKDELGAASKPAPVLKLAVLNRPPDLATRKSSRYAYVIGTPIDVFAQVGDLDDGRDNVTVSWVVFAPSQVGHQLVDLVVPDNGDPLHHTYGKRFTPLGTGDWQIEITAADPLGNTTVDRLTIPVADDKPPCLAQLAPIVPPPGAALPITEPTLFSAPVVVDDLDVYPPVAGDPVLGTTRFSWSIQGASGGTHVVVPGATTNSLVVDPTAYQPGDQVEVRVEVFDRQNAALPCPDADATCSITTPQTCLQRQTWHVVIR
jgi:hypothetical protein